MINFNLANLLSFVNGLGASIDFGPLLGSLG